MMRKEAQFGTVGAPMTAAKHSDNAAKFGQAATVPAYTLQKTKESLCLLL